MLRDGVPIEVVSLLLGHASVTTTLNVYGNSRKLRQMGAVQACCGALSAFEESFMLSGMAA
jgi:site-specific recombinase XerD